MASTPVDAAAPRPPASTETSRDDALSRLAGSLSEPAAQPAPATASSPQRVAQSRGEAAPAAAATAPKRRAQAAGSPTARRSTAATPAANAARPGVRVPDWLTSWQAAAVGSALCFGLFIMLSGIIGSGFSTLLRISSAAKAAEFAHMPLPSVVNASSSPPAAASVSSSPRGSSSVSPAWPSVSMTPSGAGPVTAFTRSPLVPTGFSVLATHPHDSGAFTQGLAWVETSPTLLRAHGSRDIMYESMGLTGQSRVRYTRFAPDAAPVTLKETSLPSNYFTEGIILLNDSVIMLTWRDGVVRVYDGVSLELRGERPQRSSNGEGWGIATDGSQLYVTDGTPTMVVWDPATLEEVRRVQVHDGDGHPIYQLNELEYIHGYVFANIWMTNWIVVIDPADGLVLARLDCSSLVPGNKNDAGRAGDRVLNGIAYRMSRVGQEAPLAAQPWEGYAWLTGKLYDTMWETKLTGLRAAEQLRAEGGYRPRQRKAAVASKSRGGNAVG